MKDLRLRILLLQKCYKIILYCLFNRTARVFEGNPTFNYVYRMGHTNITNFIVGIVLGYSIYRWQKTGETFQRYKVTKYKNIHPYIFYKYVQIFIICSRNIVICFCWLSHLLLEWCSSGAYFTWIILTPRYSSKLYMLVLLSQYMESLCRY